MNRHDPLRFVTDGQVVLVPSRVAGLLWAELGSGLRRLALESRGSDPELSAVLVALRTASELHAEKSGSASGPFLDAVADSPSTSSEVAVRLGVDPASVRRAARQGRLRGRQTATGQWLFESVEVERFMEGRGG